MGKETRLFQSKERKNRTEVGEFLRQVSEKLLSGQVVLRQGNEEINLAIPDYVVLEGQVEDEDKKKKRIEHSLEIEIKWFDNDEKSGPLEIG
mgnify:CR=1 FL=1